MATRPIQDTEKALIKSAVVAAGQTTSPTLPCKRNSDGTIQSCAAGDRSCGVPLKAGAAGDLVSFFVPAGDVIVPVKVGTGGATADAYAVVVANGVADAPTLGGGTVLVNVVGQWVESGVIGDLCGLRLFTFSGVRA